MRQCASCRFLIGDNDAGCDYCGRLAADTASDRRRDDGRIVVATFTRSPGTELVAVSNALAIPDEPVRRPTGVATVPVLARNAYPAPYPRPWNDVSGPAPAVATPPVGAITRALDRARSIGRGRRSR